MKKILLSVALIAASFTMTAQVGVGTTTPKGALQVTSTTSGVIIPQFADLTAIQAIKKADGTTALDTEEQGMQVYNIAEKKNYMWDGTNWVASGGASGKFVDGTDPLDAVYTDGNVGIGTTNPLSPLQIDVPTNGNFNVTLRTYVPDLASGQSSFISTGRSNTANNSGSFNFYYNGDGSTSNRMDFNFAYAQPSMSILAQGNVGIGTTSPRAKLEVKGTAILDSDYANLRYITNDNVGWRTGTTSNGTNIGEFYIQRSNDNFVSNFLTPIRIYENGDVRIAANEATPSVKLEVDGYIRVGSADATGDASPQVGMMRFNSTDGKFQGYGPCTAGSPCADGSTSGNGWINLH